MELLESLLAWYMGVLCGICPLFSFFCTFPCANKYLQVVITHASHIRSQHSFVFVPRATWPRNDGLWGREWLPLMTGMHKMQFDYTRFDLLRLVLWSRVFLPYIKWNSRKAQRCSKSVWTLDRCRPHTLTLMAMMWWSMIGLKLAWLLCVT